MPSKILRISEALLLRLDRCHSLDDLPEGFEAGSFVGPIESVHDPEQGWSSVARGYVLAGTVVSTMGGTRTDRAWRYSCQVGPSLHVLGPPYINHVCEDPNLHLDTERVALVARRDIRPGEELTLNYLTFEARMRSPFACSCASERCVGVIEGFELLSPARQAELADEFELPAYLSALVAGEHARS